MEILNKSGLIMGAPEKTTAAIDKNIISALIVNGWESRYSWSEVRHPDEYYVSKDEVKTPSHVSEKMNVGFSSPNRDALLEMVFERKPDAAWKMVQARMRTKDESTAIATSQKGVLEWMQKNMFSESTPETKRESLF